MREGAHQRLYERGNLTVEASIIVPAIMILIFILMSGGMLLYQKVLLHYAVSSASQQGAEVWVDSRKYIEDGSWNNEIEKDPLYYRLFDDDLFSYNKESFDNPFTEIIDVKSGLEQYIKRAQDILKDTNQSIQDRKVARVRLALYNHLMKSIIKPQHTEIKIQFSNNLFERELEVSITQKYDTPVRFINSKSSFLKMHAKASSVVTEPAEFIRNIDFCMEKIKSTGENFDIKSYLNLLKEKIS